MPAEKMTKGEIDLILWKLIGHNRTPYMRYWYAKMQRLFPSNYKNLWSK